LPNLPIYRTGLLMYPMLWSVNMLFFIGVFVGFYFGVFVMALAAVAGSERV
jgi:hypothetical protein